MKARKIGITTIVVSIAVIAGVFLLLVGFSSKPQAPDAGKEKRQAPAFVLQDYAGNTVWLSDFRGTPVVVNVWASWCPYCREELKDFALIQSEFGGRVRIVAIDRGESLQVAKEYADTLGVTDSMLFLVDPEDSFYQAIGGFSMPETIFVDKDGVIGMHKRGPMTQEEMRRRIQDAFQF